RGWRWRGHTHGDHWCNQEQSRCLTPAKRIFASERELRQSPRIEPKYFGERTELFVLFVHTAGEIRRPAQRHDLPRIGKPLADDRIVLGNFAQLTGNALA